MKTSKKQHFTYIHETISLAQREMVEAHMDEIGMNPTTEPSVYEAPALYQNIFAGSDILDVRSSLPIHSHTFAEIIYYASGRDIECLAGVHRYRLQKGDIMCVPPGLNHRVLRPDGTEPCIRYLMTFNPSFLENVFGQNYQWGPEGVKKPFILRTEGSKWESLGELFRICVRENSLKEPCWRQMLSGCANILMVQLLRAFREDSPPTIKAEKAGLFEGLLTYVDDNLKNKITLSAAARDFFTSERTITREFQKNLDISFYRYVTQRRLDVARNLLLEDIPMEAVCARVGFSDYPTFYRAFKKQYGLSPRQMKKMELEQDGEELQFTGP